MKYRVKELREAKGITQEQLAEMSGVCRSTIALFESGKPKGSWIKTLLSISNSLGCSIDDLFYTDSV